MGCNYLRNTQSTMIAMVDCNSFYASCEQVFRPDLWGKPVVVLSNNDGCVIAANKEAKQLTHIPMFEPVFKIRDILLKNKVTFFSSNYTLYGEMSQRVMNILETFSPQVEVYSIDEAFVDFCGMKHVALERLGHTIKNTIYRQVGLPVGVGIAPTKALGKLANRMAKKQSKYQYVCVLDTPKKCEEALKWAAIGDVWGIGRNHAKRLKKKGVFTAYDFTQLPLTWVRKEMTVVGERLYRELKGESCLDICTLPKPKKAIGTAKSFGQKLRDIERIEEACAYYVSEVAEVLRAQKSCARFVQVFLQTNYHSKVDQQYVKSIVATLAVPTDDTFTLIAEARKVLRKIYKPGFRYKKVGVNLLGIIPKDQVQTNLFVAPPKAHNTPLLEIFDKLNVKYGKSTVASAMIGTRIKEWELVKKERSKRYTTQWNELLTIGS